MCIYNIKHICAQKQPHRHTHKHTPTNKHKHTKRLRDLHIVANKKSPLLSLGQKKKEDERKTCFQTKRHKTHFLRLIFLSLSLCLMYDTNYAKNIFIYINVCIKIKLSSSQVDKSVFILNNFTK